MEKLNNRTLKKLGFGSMAPVLAIFAVSFSFTYYNGKNVGTHILENFGLKAPTAIITFFLLGIAAYMGIKYKKDYGAITGKVIALCFMVIIISLAFINLFI